MSSALPTVHILDRTPSRTKKILRFLAIGGGVAALSLIAPMLPHQLLKAYFRQKRFERARFLRDIKRLQHRKLIAVEELPDGKVRVKLSKRGREMTLQMDLEELTITRPQRWDGVWRLVMFDIPSSKNKARDVLRWKLKQLGFYQLQKSVFLFPFPCENEIDALGAYWHVRDYIVLMRVSGFEGEEKLRHHFRI